MWANCGRQYIYCMIFYLSVNEAETFFRLPVLAIDFSWWLSHWDFFDPWDYLLWKVLETYFDQPTPTCHEGVSWCRRRSTVYRHQEAVDRFAITAFGLSAFQFVLNHQGVSRVNDDHPHTVKTMFSLQVFHPVSKSLQLQNAQPGCPSWSNSNAL